MSNIYMIAFQVKQERIQSIVNYIKEFGVWARVTETTWCVKSTDKSFVEVRDFLNSKFVLQSDEKLMVVNVTNAPWASYNLPKEVTDWLKDK